MVPAAADRPRACRLGLSLQTQRQSPRLPRLRPAPGWGVELQPAPGRPRNPPVGAAEAGLRLHLQQSPVEPRLGGGIVSGKHERAGDRVGDGWGLGLGHPVQRHRAAGQRPTGRMLLTASPGPRRTLTRKV
jgi:hypothetical protein